MKKCLRTARGISLVGSLVFLAASPAISDEIEWEEIPGTRVTDSEFGEYASSIGMNTIVRRGNAINFDFLSGADAGYARIAGNCRTEWLVMIASGYYTNDGQLVVNDRTQRSFDPRINEPRLALEFACSQ